MVTESESVEYRHWYSKHGKHPWEFTHTEWHRALSNARVGDGTGGGAGRETKSSGAAATLSAISERNWLKMDLPDIPDILGPLGKRPALYRDVIDHAMVSGLPVPEHARNYQPRRAHKAPSNSSQ